MMGSKRNWVLAALLGLLVLVDVFSLPKDAELREAKPLLDAWAPGAVQKVEISDQEGRLEVVGNGQGQFTIPGFHNFPARPVVVKNLADGLATLTDLDLLSEDAASHKRYGLTEEQAVRIQLRNGEGAILADLFQGDLAPGARASYVRRADSDRVFRAPNFAQRVVTDPLPWIEGRWMPLDGSLAKRVSVSSGDLPEALTWTLAAGSRIDWRNAQGEGVSATKVQRLLSALGRVTIQGVESQGTPGWMEDAGTMRIEVELAGGETWSGSLAPEAEGDPKASVQRGGHGYGVVLAPAAVRGVRRSVSRLVR